MLDIVPRNQLCSLSISENDIHVLRSKLGRHEQVVDDDDSCCLSSERARSVRCLGEVGIGGCRCVCRCRCRRRCRLAVV